METDFYVSFYDWFKSIPVLIIIYDQEIQKIPDFYLKH